MRAISSILTGCAAAGLGGSVAAAELSCVAERQCRGDAQAMCAPSTLKIAVTAEGRLWVDGQGPYGARASREGAARIWTIEAFGGRHGLRVEGDGRFLYRGNRGKRFTGTCRETGT